MRPSLGRLKDVFLTNRTSLVFLLKIMRYNTHFTLHITTMSSACSLLMEVKCLKVKEESKCIVINCLGTITIEPYHVKLWMLIGVSNHEEIIILAMAAQVNGVLVQQQQPKAATARHHRWWPERVIRGVILIRWRW